MPDRAAPERPAAEPPRAAAEPARLPALDRPDSQKERRRASRFSCFGQAQLIRLPSDGDFMAGKIHDLSLGGCRLGLNETIDSGARMELVIRANAASFRALGIVKGLHSEREAGIEFVQLSSGGRDLLEDLIGELARLRATTDQLMAARRQVSAEAFHKQLEAARFQALMFATRFPFLDTTLAEEISQHEDGQLESGESPLEECPRVIPINLFG
jgi:PilZ domain